MEADVLAEADPAVRGLIIAYDVLGGQFAWVPVQPGLPPTVDYVGPDDLATVSRTAVPMPELVSFHHETARQLRSSPEK